MQHCRNDGTSHFDCCRCYYYYNASDDYVDNDFDVAAAAAAAWHVDYSN